VNTVIITKVNANSIPFLEVEVDDYHLTAGDNNQIEIYITNVGEGNASNVEVYLTIPQTLSGIAIVKDSYKVFDEILFQETESMYPTLYVSNSFPLGAYNLELTLVYQDSLGLTYQSSLQVGIIVDAIEPEELVIDVDVEDYLVSAGKENEINITITNNGEKTLYDVKAEIISATPGIVVLEGFSQIFDQLKVGKSDSFMPTIGISRSVPLGAYSITLSLEYSDSKNVIYRSSENIGVFIDSIEPPESTKIKTREIHVMPTDVHPGDEFTIIIELENYGTDVYDVQAQYSVTPNTPIAPLSPTLIFVDDMESNDSTTINYDLIVSGDAQARIYTLNFLLTYFDKLGQLKSESEIISIDVNSIINFQLLNVQPQDLTLEPGEIVSVEADLLLIGTETVEFVQVTVIENSSNPFLSIPESYEYIGRVDPDSPIPFDIQFMVDSNASAGDYTLQMSVSYWDEYNRDRQAILELPTVIEEFENTGEDGSYSQRSIWDAFWDFMRNLLGMKP
jgi:hypothetical protein